MKVLFVGFVWPEPSSSAAGQNILSYVNTCINSGWDVSFCSAAAISPDSYPFAQHNIKQFEAALNCNSFNGTISKLQPDIVIFDRFLSFEQFASRVQEACPDALLVIDTEDLHGLRTARHNFIKKHNHVDTFFESDHIVSHTQYLYNDTSIRELSCIYQADLSIVLSDFEHQLLLAHYKLKPHQVRHLPFILNNSENTQIKTAFSEKKDFVFIGNYRHAPNIDALRHLKERIWPQIFDALKSHSPNVSCHIYGAYISDKVKQLEDKNRNFIVHGKAKNQFEFITNARLMLAPIRFGAGVKGKLLDAMRVCTPSITTPLGAEGINQQNWAGAICKNNDEFIEQAIQIYTNKSQWQQAAKYAHAILKSGFTVSENSRRLIEVLIQAKAQQQENRQKNFMQQLLNRQAFHASKYMTQWIAAKNKNA